MVIKFFEVDYRPPYYGNRKNRRVLVRRAGRDEREEDEIELV